MDTDDTWIAFLIFVVVCTLLGLIVPMLVS